MVPINELLSRIIWDKNFSLGHDFKIGYYDRIENRLIIVDFNHIIYDSEDKFAFSMIDRKGDVKTIPLHRVKKVWRDDELIWDRWKKEE